MTNLAHQIYIHPGNITRLDMYKASGSTHKSQIITEDLRSVIVQYVAFYNLSLGPYGKT